MTQDPDSPHAGTEARIRAISRGRKAVYSLLPLLLLLCLIEGAARLLEGRSPTRIDLGLAFTEETRHCQPAGPEGRLMLPHPRGSGLEESTFLAQKGENTFRIVTLGGSSVAFLQEHLTRLEAELTEAYAGRLEAVEIINAGYWSYGSQRVLIVAREMLEYEPDLFVLYTGHNEFEDLKQLQIAQLGPPPWLRALMYSAVFRLFAERVTQHRIDLLEEQRNLDILRRGPFSAPEEWDLALQPGMLQERMRHFRNNLALMAAMCAQRGVPLIVGTVPSNHWLPSLPEEAKAVFDERYWPLRESGDFEGYHRGVRELLTNNLRRQSSDAENAIIAEIAAAHALPVADVYAAVCAAEPHGIPGETLFDDPCHLNEAGNDLWIEVFTPVIRDNIDRYLTRAQVVNQAGAATHVPGR